jgi:hypothetical protein
MPWDYRPWGCASGKKGSCNNGWIQFEICEDDTNNKDYFEKVYKEACEFTAYICDLYNLDPKGTVTMNGVKVPVILCHQDSYKLGLGNNHSDIYHWFKKFGKDMDDVRNDVAALMKKPTSSKVEEPKKEEAKKEEVKIPATDAADTNKPIKYVVRKSWIEEKSQIGAYVELENAKKACDQAGSDYEVYNINTKALVYPLASGSEDFKVGDVVTLVNGAKWSTGATIPGWVYKQKLYVRQIRDNGIIAISTLETGAITGTIKAQYLNLKVASKTNPVTIAPEFKPYLIIVTAKSLNVRGGAGTQYSINAVVNKGQVYTIVNEKNGWGKLKSGTGWIKLDGYTKKL